MMTCFVSFEKNDLSKKDLVNNNYTNTILLPVKVSLFCKQEQKCIITKFYTSFWLHMQIGTRTHVNACFNMVEGTCWSVSSHNKRLETNIYLLTPLGNLMMAMVTCNGQQNNKMHGHGRSVRSTLGGIFTDNFGRAVGLESKLG